MALFRKNAVAGCWLSMELAQQQEMPAGTQGACCTLLACVLPAIVAAVELEGS